VEEEKGLLEVMSAVHRYGSTVAIMAAVAFAGCSERDLTVPTASEVEAAYMYDGELSAEMLGNVAEITVVQPSRHIRRGGSLWAKVGPYVVLFSEETQQLFLDFPGLAGVRVITRTPDRGEVARVFLTRDRLTDVLWRRSINIAGRARQDGTRRPSLLENLVRWGEDHTEYQYNRELIP
jgi:hypothetical protein